MVFWSSSTRNCQGMTLLHGAKIGCLPCFTTHARMLLLFPLSYIYREQLARKRKQLVLRNFGSLKRLLNKSATTSSVHFCCPIRFSFINFFEEKKTHLFYISYVKAFKTFRQKFILSIFWKISSCGLLKMIGLLM